MIDRTAIDEEVLELWESQRLLISLKQVSGKAFVDARKWIAFENAYRPKSGLMLSFEHWPIAMKKIQEMLDRHIEKLWKLSALKHFL